MENTVLIIGLGSMGKRRTRNLQALGIKNIVGFDLKEDRRKQAAEEYGIITTDNFEKALSEYKFNAFVISVPPDVHHVYMKKAIELGIPAFIEASVVDTDFEKMIADANSKGVLLAPSCTLYFHPAVKKICDIIQNNKLGKISNIIHHSGQYLPDWHTYESVSDFYVSKKETGGAREIVPFELTWITLLLGLPQRVVGLHKKTIEIEGAPDIDDTYNLLMDYGSMIYNLSIDVVSRYATRRVVINGDKKQLFWSWDDNCIKIFDPVEEKWDIIKYDTLAAQDGYNKNITEQMYIDEMNTFFKAATGKGTYPNSLQKDHEVLKILYAAERSDKENKIQVL